MGKLAGLLLLGTAMLTGQVSDARYSKLARGMNLTRWFQYGSPLRITAVDRDLLHNSGFTSVRIAVAPQYLLAKWASEQDITRNLANMDAGIDLFLNSGIAVTLDFHADAEYLDYYVASGAAPAELINTWRMLATRYAGRNPELLFFEIMNEPDDRFTQADWDAEQKLVLAAIREKAPRHTVLLSPVNWSGLDALLPMTPYEDPNVIYVVHYYTPSVFTHQGAAWTGAPPAAAALQGVPWPAFLTEPGESTLLRHYRDDDWGQSRMEWDMGLVADWQRQWKARVVVNEFGVYKPNSPPESRARWLYEMRSALEAEHLAWAMWDYGGGFDLLTRSDGIGEADPPILAALGLMPRTAEDPVRTGSPPVLGSPRSVQIGAQPDTKGYAEGILSIDINGDGLADLVVAPVTYPDLTDRPVQLFLNSGDGVMKPALFDGPPPVQKFVSSILAGRFDRSGRAGLFFADRGDDAGARNGLALPSNGGKMRNATANLPQQQAKTMGAAVGDVDGDGIDDLVVFDPSPRLLRNDGTGHFTFDDSAFDEVTDTFRCGVFAGTSLVAFGLEGGRVFVNDGTGHFRSEGLLLAPPDSGGAATGGCAAVTDLNNDGNPDVIAAFKNDLIQVWINNNDGTFRNETAARMGVLPASIAGIRRLALFGRALVITRVGDAPLVRVDRGKGVFADPGVNLPPDLWVVAPGDFNRDGYLDLIFGQGGTAPLTARFGQAPL